ncbi:zinc finger, C3HC4 type (RING finger) protein (macronuclear) [Tetrahymena thermophila SB210]|uniref:Zinc finger, C3HC4 type (RING finger) protein n=1 Tax=Tetrahymena thermophila (strain SB210) TaxID=312017 RepID=W7XER6_TETTS|nr:zinc finger, C3HC4 type (RING finger) protein [Tetrahymena thermophila SB210]EWS72401.1 zinc finger, C3HC4 type (RING finger) protein [Tetrahymena thermophila SB210]|eukprot:XP_012655057.1 zinc finger, C3HC4 type (RING finger) protein [Tetrahymena thermophila SB210]
MFSLLFKSDQCKYCNKNIAVISKLIHEAQCEKTFNKYQVKTQGQNTITQSNVQLIQCSICNEQFSSEDQLDNHIEDCFQINQLVTCEICQQSFPQFQIEDHKLVCQEGSKIYSQQFQNKKNQNMEDENIQDQENEEEMQNQSENISYNDDQEQYEEDDDQQEEDHNFEYEEESKQNQMQFTDDQINQILDRGGQLPQFEDHDLSNTGGLNNQQIEVFPTSKFDPKKNENLSIDLISCSICLDEFEKFQWLKTLGCLHRFHKKCINHWLIKNRLCPICKVDQKQFV